MLQGDSARQRTFPETQCGRVSLVMLDRVQALPHLAFPPSMEPSLVFWYDKPQLLRTVECPPMEEPL